jgi:uncharacterized membrane protein YgaE (UPF0421/DUF939 family)
MRQVCTDTIHRLNYDSLTVALLKDSQTFYSISFNSILVTVGIAVAASAILISVLAIINFKAAAAPKKELEKIKKDFSDISNKILDLEKNLKEQSEKQKNEIWKQIAYTNLTTAALYLEKNDSFVHFSYLKNYFSIIFSNEIELNDSMLYDIETISSFVDEYIKNEKITFSEIIDFLVSLKSLLDKSKEKGKEIHYNKINEIFEKLNRHYGKDKIKKVIEEREKEIREGF